MNHQKCIWNFLSFWLANQKGFFIRPIMLVLKSRYTGVGQNKDFNAVSQVDLTRVKFCVWCRLHVAGNRNSMFFLLVGLHCLNTSCHSLGFMADKSRVLPWQGCYFTGHVKCICHGAILFNGRSLCLLQNVFYWWSLWLHDGCFTGFLHSPCKEMSIPGMFVNLLILFIHNHILITILVDTYTCTLLFYVFYDCHLHDWSPFLRWPLLWGYVWLYEYKAVCNLVEILSQTCLYYLKR